MSLWTRLRMISVAGAATLSLSACATGPVGIQPSPDALYPEALLQCMDEPEVEPRQDVTIPRSETEKAAYLSGLREAFLDCEDTVEVGWRERKDRYAAQYDEANSGWWPF